MPRGCPIGMGNPGLPKRVYLGVMVVRTINVALYGA